jgi:hypothetical protein
MQIRLSALIHTDWAFFDFTTPDIQRTDEELRGTKRLPLQPLK